MKSPNRQIQHGETTDNRPMGFKGRPSNTGTRAIESSDNHPVDAVFHPIKDSKGQSSTHGTPDGAHRSTRSVLQSLTCPTRPWQALRAGAPDYSPSGRLRNSRPFSPSGSLRTSSPWAPPTPPSVISKGPRDSRKARSTIGSVRLRWEVDSLPKSIDNPSIRLSNPSNSRRLSVGQSSSNRKAVAANRKPTGIRMGGEA
jgi:hypothetical protein